jgi:hypothetical protein
MSLTAARKARPVRAPVFEPLEHRLLMDAALTGSALPAPLLEAAGPEAVIQLPASGAGTQAQPATELLDVSPALFVENQGQWSDPAVRYVHDGNRVDVAATGTGIVFQVAGTQATDTQALRFSASFVGARPVLPAGSERSPTVVNYFVGDPSLWRQNVPAYEQVVYEGLYEGVDLYVQGLGSHLKYEFHVAPGADWSQISIRYDGIAGLSLAADGSSVLDLGEGWGTLVDDRPYLYQVIDGQRVGVAGSFRLLDSRTCAFDVTGPYDPARELVIDPNLVWSTYLGGSGGDWAYGVALDSTGNVYVTGQTQSADWTFGGSGTTLGSPTQDTALGGSFQGVADAFVAKLSPTGAGLWRTYLGGAGDDRGYAVALDSGGNAYVTGQTESAGWTSGGFDTTYNGAVDAFVAKLGSLGEVLWSSYLGGTGGDWGYDLVVDSSDNLYVTGQTESPENWTLGGFDMTYNGASDAFVAKVSPAGACLWSTYLGGPDRDQGYGIAVDSAGNVYVTGTTLSAIWVSAGYDATHDGAPDAFVARLSAAGDESPWSTCLGGSSDDYGRDIAVDAGGNLYVTGETLVADWTSAGSDPTHKDIPDAFVAKLTAAGAGLWSTPLGGNKGDWGYGVAVDAAGNVYVTGTTTSSDWSAGGFDITYHGGDSDAFVAQLDADGVAVWSSYLGGSGADAGYALAVDPAGYLYVAGQTESAGWTSGGGDTAYAASGDAFVVKISFGRLVPVYRFWSESLGTHFYTIKAGEKDKLINQYSDIWTYEGPAYRAFADATQPGVAPVYRFWSESLGTHFYTIKAGEKDKLIRDYATVWTFEGVAFYGYAAAVPAAGSYPVYRFWSESLGTHFYTIKAGEKDKLIRDYATVWTFEGVAWYDLLVLP